MPRLFVRGWYYDQESEDAFSKGWAHLDGNRVLEVNSPKVSIPKGETINGIVLPELPNAHTHLGDFLLRDKVEPGMSVQELVAPPNGLKHRLLPGIDIEESISKAIIALKRSGVGCFCDFREGGTTGVEQMARAMVTEGRHLRSIILGRPKGLSYDKAEMDNLLNICQGIGISGMGDWDPSDLATLAKHVRDKGKLFALHVSEVEREDIDRVLDLRPSFVIHMTKGDRGDFHRLSVFGVPVVACPRSNMFYGRGPDLRGMLDSDVELCLGTDNAMMSDLSMFGELKAVRDLGLSKLEAWELIENSWKLLNQDEGMRIDAPNNKSIVIRTATEDPLKVLTEKGPGLEVFRPGDVS